MASKPSLEPQEVGEVDALASGPNIANSRVKRPRQQLKTTAMDEFSDEEMTAPKKKRAKATAKKSNAPAEPKTPKAPSSGSASKRSSSASKAAATKAESAEDGGEERKQPQPKLAFISSSSSDSQYHGVPLDHLRTMLTPQEYIRVSILRSMSESLHAGNEKNVSRSIHPDLASSRPSLAFETELRAMVSTWVELLAVSGACLEILEAEAVRYTTQLLIDLKRKVVENEELGLVNGRPVKQLMYSNQSQGIDPRMMTFVSQSKANQKTPSSGAKNIAPSPASKESESKAREEAILKSATEMDVSDDDEEEEIETEPSAPEASQSNNADPEESEYNPKAEWHSLKSASDSDKMVKPKYDRIPIAQMDHLAEALVQRHISLVRRLEYIARRLAEDDRTQRVNEQSKAERVAEENADQEDEEELLDVWAPSPELEAFVSQQDSSETTEKQHVLRETILSERMERVQRMNVAHLDEWQSASSVSFARPNLSKFKAWMNVCCGWDPKEVCIPPHLIVALNFALYEHLRYIVRSSIQMTPSPETGANLKVLLPDRLRAEISARIEAGDAVHTKPLFAGTHPKPSS